MNNEKPHDLNSRAAHVLSSAFAADPLIHKLFQGNETKTRHFFEFILKYCEGSGGKILTEYSFDGASDNVNDNANDKLTSVVNTKAEGTALSLASVACLEYPATSASPAGATIRSSYVKSTLQLIAAFIRFTFQCGLKSLGMVNDYMRLTTRHRPKDRHHYLICIGVDPRFKGLGMGKNMLNAIHGIVDNDPTSTGIGLDTENADNVALYEHFGYCLTGTETLDGMTIYTMFRPRKNISGQAS